MTDRPRGTRDFPPEEMEKRRALESRLRETLQSFGYREVQTPTFEHVELFTRKSGEGVLKQIYNFTDKGGRELTLRPELTAPVLRYYVSDLSKRPKPLKLFYYGPCFRYEEPQKGRYREFWQFGVELIGPTGPAADADHLGVANAAFEAAGLARFNLHVGHVGILRALVSRLPVDDLAKGKVWRAIDKDEPVGDMLDAEGVPAALASAVANLASLERRLVLGDEEGAPRAVEEFFDEARQALAGLDADVAKEVEGHLASLQETTRLLEHYGVRTVVLDLGVVRGLDYYTGVVFELELPDLGAEKQAGGGGAYALSELFGGEAVGSAGFGLGFDRMLIGLEREGNLPPSSVALDAYIAPIGDAARVAALDLARELRAAGLRVDVDLMGRKPTKNFDYANAIGARRVVVLGEKELAARAAAVKDMATGEQRTVPRADLVAALR